MKIKIIGIICIGVLFAVSVFILYRVHSITTNSIVTTHKETSVTYSTIADRLKYNQPFTILLLGYAGGKHDGTYLTDSIIAIHVNPASRKTYLISIPRDTWTTMPLTDSSPRHWKINAAYQIGIDDKNYPNKKEIYTGDGGGGKLVEDVVSQVLGQPIDRFVAIDFAGFKNTIDTLGGVDVTVETAFDDFAYPLDSIPDESCGHTPEDIAAFTATVSAEQQLWNYFPCRYEHLHFDAGKTHMDGKTALSYVRSRHSAVDGSDFGRARRQRNLLVAVKDKILSPGFIPKALPFIDSLGKDLKTDISLSDMKALLQHMPEFNSYEINTYALTDRNYLNQTFSADGQAILAPKEGIDNWSKIHRWVADIFSGKQILTPAIVMIENGTKTPGLAQSATDRLNSLSIQTIAPKNSPMKTDLTTVTIFDKNINTDDMNTIMKEFGVSGVTFGTHTSEEFNVLVKIGNEYATQNRNKTATPIDKRN